jgi:hypothetical protein
MGRRELLILVVFAVLGAGAYLAMAPPARPGERSFSLRDFFQHVRTEMQGDSAMASTTLTKDHAVSPEVRELAVDNLRATVRIVGEERRDVKADLKAEVSGPDMREAESRAQNVRLTIDEVAHAVRVRVTMPPGIRRRRLELTIRAPQRLRAHLGGVSGQVEVRGMAEATVLAGRLETRIRDIAGAVRVDHREGPLEIVNVGALHVTARRDELRITDVKGTFNVDLTDARLEARGIAGEMTIEARRANLELRRPIAPVRLTAFDTRIDIRESRAALHIEGERSRTRIEVDAPAAISASTTDAPLELRVPASAAVTIEAVATDSTIRADDFGLPVSGDAMERRLSGALRGGGPLISLRTRRGPIVLQKLTSDATQSTVDRR